MASRKLVADRMNPLVDAFVKKARKWQEEINALREIVLACGLTEELKWRQPCYAFNGKNVIIIGGFKEYCALMYFKGALMKDPKKILVRPGEHSQSSRQVRFTSVGEIAAARPTLESYIQEAIAIENAGLKVTLKKVSEYSIPKEFDTRLKHDPALKTAFRSLTPGRQRAYLLNFSQPKRSETREARIDKWIPQILRGKGMDD